jgi:hypothetical protein
VVGAAATGTSHLKNGLPCQDAQDYRLTSRGALLLALADGAGSATHSQEGAIAAVQSSLAVLEHELEDVIPGSAEEWEGVVRAAFGEARASLFDLAMVSSESLRQFSTTLLLVAVMDGWLAMGQLGDGVVVTGEAEGALQVLTQPQRGEYANETYFLTQEEAGEQVQVVVTQQPVRRIAVLSDGLLRLALRLPAYQAHLPFFEPLFAFAAAAQDGAEAIRHLEGFLSSERVCSRTDDDKSLLLAVCAAGGEAS